MRIGFGDFVLDDDTREFFCGGRTVHLPVKTFRLLELLLGSRPKAIPKAKLMEAIWPGVFVAEGNLARLVAELRDALGEDAREPRFVRTVHGFGYSFAGEAKVEGAPLAPPARAVFRLLWRDREFALREGENILGRAPEAVAWIDVHSVSRHHARIVVSGDAATIEDLGSKNGTFLADEPVTAARPLGDGDRLRIGTVEMTLRRYPSGVSTESVRQ